MFRDVRRARVTVHDMAVARLVTTVMSYVSVTVMLSKALVIFYLSFLLQYVISILPGYGNKVQQNQGTLRNQKRSTYTMHCTVYRRC